MSFPRIERAEKPLIPPPSMQRRLKFRPGMFTRPARRICHYRCSRKSGKEADQTDDRMGEESGRCVRKDREEARQTYVGAVWGAE